MITENGSQGADESNKDRPATPEAERGGTEKKKPRRASSEKKTPAPAPEQDEKGLWRLGEQWVGEPAGSVTPPESGLTPPVPGAPLPANVGEPGPGMPPEQGGAPPSPGSLGASPESGTTSPAQPAALTELILREIAFGRSPAAAPSLEGAPALAWQAANDRNRIIVDDALNNHSQSDKDPCF